MYPAHIVIESYIFKGWPKSRKRMMLKNVVRVIVVAISVVFTIALKKKIDKFLSILGAVACIPIAFIFPSVFHLKSCANT